MRGALLLCHRNAYSATRGHRSTPRHATSPRQGPGSKSYKAKRLQMLKFPYDAQVHSTADAQTQTYERAYWSVNLSKTRRLREHACKHTHTHTQKHKHTHTHTQREREHTHTHTHIHANHLARICTPQTAPGHSRNLGCLLAFIQHLSGQAAPQDCHAQHTSAAQTLLAHRTQHPQPT